ncbi:MAG TPA: LAGLIDADG family homing endonuclease [Thermoplasmata archaeon]|nr:LAGLIDADG family homing endonuclease [Thermoplasmata archaeon]
MVAVKLTLPAPPQLQGRWAALLEEAGLRPQILALADKFPEERSLEIPFSTIDSSDTGLADLLLDRPEEVIDAGRRAMRDLLPVAGPEADRLRLRPVGLPSTVHRSVRGLRESDLNHLVAIDGIVRRVTEVRPQIRDAVFQCAACHVEFHEPQDDASMLFREPLECPDSQGGCGRPAGRTRFRLLPEKSTYVDAQRIEIQENPETLRGGAHPQGLATLLTEDLTGHVLPGNRVVLNGVLKSYQRASPSRSGVVRNTTFDLLLLGVSVESKQVQYDEIEISPEEEKLILSFRGDPTVVDKIILSLAPTIKGMEQEKEAIALQLFGGVEKRHSDGIRVRGDIHVLLVGDPGVAKSQLLRYVADVAPRAIYTSGKGATAAGLTAAAVKDDFAGGRWVLEAGMLVLADGGMAMIDELDKMTPEDRSAMHEVLEQQSYHSSFEIMFLNGEKRAIGEFVEGQLQRNPERVIARKDCEILPLDHENYSLLSTDFQCLHGMRIDRVSRHAAPSRFVRVTYGNGRVLTVTPEHPLFVWRAGQWATVSAESALPGDLVPGVSEYPRALNEAVFKAPEMLTGRKEIDFPEGLGPDLSRLLGYLISEGHVPSAPDATPAEISVSNTDPSIVKDVEELFRYVFGICPYVQVHLPSRRRRATLPLHDVRAVSVDLLHFIQSNFPEVARKSPEKRIPGSIFHALENCRVQFLLGAYRGDGFYDSQRFGLTTSSGGLARDYADLLLSLGIYSYIASSVYRYGKERTGTAYKIVVSGAQSQRRFFELVGRYDPRAEKIRSFVERSEVQPKDRDRLPHELVSRLKCLLGELDLDDGSFHQAMTGGGQLHRRTMARYLHHAITRLESMRLPCPHGPSPREIRKLYHVPLGAVAARTGRSIAWVTLHDEEAHSVQAEEILRITAALAQEKVVRVSEEVAALTRWVESPLRFVPIRSVEVIPNSGEKWVYDVTVEPTHTFVSDGLVLHNTVSIAKAGITSTLNARCPVLAAANPKWGRFTPDRTISEQIDLPPTLLSRFDVIFSIQDHPNQERDRRLANRILASHREGEVAGAGGIGVAAEVAPFSPDLLKKYIAYARRNIRPILSDAALLTLEDFYVKVRRQGEEPNAPVPITARQLEALVRLSEAAARARLSNVVEEHDAQRATQIMENYLRRVSTAEDGRLDIDLTQTGVSHSQRERHVVVLRVMRELQEAGGGTFTMEAFLAAAEKAGVEPKKAESLFITLRNQGEVIEPRPNQLQLVRFAV